MISTYLLKVLRCLPNSLWTGKHKPGKGQSISNILIKFKKKKIIFFFIEEKCRIVRLFFIFGHDLTVFF